MIGITYTQDQFEGNEKCGTAWNLGRYL